MLVISTAMANEQVTTNEHCETVSRFANKIMQLRHSGYEITKLKKIADSDKEYGQILHVMINEAYSSPKLSVYTNQLDDAREFANTWGARCYRSEETEL